MNIILDLSFPPTVNNYYSHTRNGVYISKKGREFRGRIEREVIEQLGAFGPIQEQISLDVILYPPDKRKRDLDNYMKSLLDALTFSKVWVDDSQIDQLMIYRGVPVKGGKTFARVSACAPVFPDGNPELYLPVI